MINLFIIRNVDTTSHNRGVACSGILINTNTFESFRQTHPEKFIDMIGKHLLAAITNGTALNEPWRLTLFLVLSYADLKKYRFHYWAAYPTPFNLPEMYYQCPAKKIKHVLNDNIIDELKIKFQQLDCCLKAFFTLIITSDDAVDAVDNDNEKIKIISLADGVDYVVKKKYNESKNVCIFMIYIKPSYIINY